MNEISRIKAEIERTCHRPLGDWVENYLVSKELSPDQLSYWQEVLQNLKGNILITRRSMSIIQPNEMVTFNNELYRVITRHSDGYYLLCRVSDRKRVFVSQAKFTVVTRSLQKQNNIKPGVCLKLGCHYLKVIAVCHGYVVAEGRDGSRLEIDPRLAEFIHENYDEWFKDWKFSAESFSTALKEKNQVRANKVYELGQQLLEAIVDLDRNRGRIEDHPPSEDVHYVVPYAVKAFLSEAVRQWR